MVACPLIRSAILLSNLTAFLLGESCAFLFVKLFTGFSKRYILTTLAVSITKRADAGDEAAMTIRISTIALTLCVALTLPLGSVASDSTGAAPKAEKAAKKQAALVRRMGIDPENQWEANYTVLPGKEKVVTELQKLAENAPAIYLATDLDREGEAIAWHLQEEIGGTPDAETGFSRQCRVDLSFGDEGPDFLK